MSNEPPQGEGSTHSSQLIIGYALILLLLGSGILITENILTRYEQITQVTALEENRTLRTEIQELRQALLGLTQPSVTPASARASESATVSINRVGLAELDALPGIGEVRARAILEEREARGPFIDGADLRSRVSKLPQSVYESILPLIDFQVSE